MKIVWSEIAESDLDELYDFIARDVSFYAEQFLDRLIDAVGLLADHPKFGRLVPEAEEREDVREVLYQSYRVIYLVGADQVSILTIVHGRRDLAGRAAKPWEIE